MLDEALNISLQTTTAMNIEIADTATVTDAQLVAAVVAGDERAFATIFDRYKRHVTKVVGRFFRDRSEIEEYVQQSFTKAYFSIKSFKGGEEYSLAAWLTRITVNVCYDEFRRRQRRGESLFSEIGEEENGILESLPDNRQRSPEASLAASQLINKLLGTLDPKDQIAMHLVYSEEFSLNEAAQAIGISSSNLKSRLFRCRNQLKARFGHLFQ